MRVLLIEDDLETASRLSVDLRKSGCLVGHSADGHDGIIAAISERYDVVVVDRMLPGIDGLDVVRSIRQAGIKVPAIFLTALAGISDRVDGLRAGGDDYLVKPFAFSELLARLEALVRRPPLSHGDLVLRVADLEVDVLARTARRGSREINLQPREFDLLACMMRNAGRVVTRMMLLESVWEFHFEPKTKIVETHISRLRSKIDLVGQPPLIETRRGHGYVIRAPSWDSENRKFSAGSGLRAALWAVRAGDRRLCLRQRQFKSGPTPARADRHGNRVP
jgi:two-component system OmpR family response regulator